MTEQEFINQVETLITNLQAIKNSSNVSEYPFDRHDFPLNVCECVAELTGANETFVKMFNRKFRTDALTMMFEQAQEMVAA